MSYDVTLFLQLILTHTTKTHNNGENMTQIHFDDKRDKKVVLYLLDNVLKFIVSFFEDDENIQPIKKDLEFIINKLK